MNVSMIGLPHNKEAEAALLGCLLASEDHPEIDDLINEVSPKVFHGTNHKRIYETIKRLREKGQIANIITITDSLREDGYLEEAGGGSYISGLLTIGCIPSQARQYFEILRRDFQKRSLIESGLNLIDGAKAGREPEDLIKEVSGRIEDTFKNIPRRIVDIIPHLESWNDIRGLEIKVEWIIDRLIPKGAIIIIFGKGGIGKTWLFLAIARCIGNGIPFLGLPTIKTMVIFIDFENPLAVLNIRLDKLGDGEGVHFWRAHNATLKAPRLDSQDWEAYKSLPQGAVLIFDTLRSSQGKDENASNDMALILGRLKELRDMGFTVIILHHTSKNSDKAAKGSTAIVDLADHILGLVRVKKKADGQDEAVEDDDYSDEKALYRFGTYEKTRFEPYHLYLTLNPDRGFELAPDPQEDTLKRMHEILLKYGTLTKSSFIENCKGLDAGVHKLRKLVDVGHGRYWNIERHKDQKNAQFVIPKKQLVSYSPLYSTEKLNNCQKELVNVPVKLDKADTLKSLVNTELVSFSDGSCQTVKQGNIQFCGPDEIIEVLEEA